MIEQATLFLVTMNTDADTAENTKKTLTSSASPAWKLALDCQVRDENFEERIKNI